MGRIPTGMRKEISEVTLCYRALHRSAMQKKRGDYHRPLRIVQQYS